MESLDSKPRQRWCVPDSTSQTCESNTISPHSEQNDFVVDHLLEYCQQSRQNEAQTSLEACQYLTTEDAGKHISDDQGEDNYEHQTRVNSPSRLVHPAYLDLPEGSVYQQLQHHGMSQNSNFTSAHGAFHIQDTPILETAAQYTSELSNRCVFFQRLQEYVAVPFKRNSDKSSRSSLRSFTSLIPVLTLMLSLINGASASVTRIYEAPHNVTVLEDTTVVLPCKLQYLKGDVQWTKDGLGLGIDRSLPGYPRYSMIGQDRVHISEYNLQIHNVAVSDEAAYECQVLTTNENPRGLRTEPAYLAVTVPPQVPFIGKTYMERGEHFLPVVLHKINNITCTARKGKPTASITWFLDGERLMTGTTKQSIKNGNYIDTVGRLSLNVTKNMASKRIWCEAGTPHMTTPHRVSALLDVQYAPDITMTRNVTGRPLKEHDYVMFKCEGNAHPSYVDWSWHQGDLTIAGETSNTYVVKLKHSHNGQTISCEAKNTIGTTRQSMKLEVLYGARIEDITEVVGTDIGKDAELRCHADGNPDPIVTWRRQDRVGGALDSHRSVVSASETLSLKKVTRANLGWYICSATVQGFASASARAFLLENDKPTISSEKQQSATEGKSASLECIVQSVPAPSRVSWHRSDGRDVNRAGPRFQMEEHEILYGIKSILHISAVRSEDFGFYNCTVQNDYGIARGQIELVEKHVLPITWIIIGVIAGLVIIFIIGLACVLYRRCRSEEHQGSVLGSYTDTDSSSDKASSKKRDKADSPSTLMGQLRQDYNKEMYRFSADYDDMPYKDHTGKANNNGYGYIEPYETYSDHQVYDGEYVHRGDDLIPDRFDPPMYTPSAAYNMSSFRTNNLDRVTPPTTLSRLTPLHMSNSKLATDV